ncbi:MAG: amidohydrolase family protein, partial [Clostridiaceae bacterium]|nr:amidohydrolase family protein [Clostridiaceae bacterium]
MNSSKTKNLIQTATGRKIADLVIENCNVVNVFSQEIIYGKLAISDGVFIGIGDYEGTEVIDGEGRYIVPGLIDSHVHIESSMGSPYQFARAVLPRGTTTVIS